MRFLVKQIWLQLFAMLTTNNMKWNQRRHVKYIEDREVQRHDQLHMKLS